MPKSGALRASHAWKLAHGPVRHCGTGDASSLGYPPPADDGPAAPIEMPVAGSLIGGCPQGG